MQLPPALEDSCRLATYELSRSATTPLYLYTNRTPADTDQRPHHRREYFFVFAYKARQRQSTFRLLLCIPAGYWKQDWPCGRKPKEMIHLFRRLACVLVRASNPL